MDNLRNQLAGWLDKTRFQIFIRLVRLINRTRAKHQRRAQSLDKRRFGAVVHHFGLRAQQFLDHFHQLMVRRAFVAGNRRMQFDTVRRPYQRSLTGASASLSNPLRSFSVMPGSGRISICNSQQAQIRFAASPP